MLPDYAHSGVWDGPVVWGGCFYMRVYWGFVPICRCWGLWSLRAAVCWVGVVGLASWVGYSGWDGALASPSTCFLATAAAAAGACFLVGGGRWAMSPAKCNIFLIFP